LREKKGGIMRKYWAALIIVFLVAGTSLANQENLAKASMVGLAKKDNVLREKIVQIDSFIWKIVEDEVVTGSEMLTLWDLTQDFKKTKARFDKELNLAYGVKTTIILNPSTDTVLEEYLSKHNFHRRDSNGEVKRHLAILTGKDVTVLNIWHLGPIAFLLLILDCLVTAVGIVAFKTEGENVSLVILLFVCAVVLSLVLFL